MQKNRENNVKMQSDKTLTAYFFILTIQQMGLFPNETR